MGQVGGQGDEIRISCVWEYIPCCQVTMIDWFHYLLEGGFGS